MKKDQFFKLHFSKGSRILDLGCYDGKKNKWMRKNYAYQGVDLLYEDDYVKKEDFLPWLKKNKKRYDLILAEFCLQQVPRKKLGGVIRDIHRALLPDGYLFISSFNESDPVGPFFTQNEYLKMGNNLKIVSWNRTKGMDLKKRERSTTEILFQNNLRT